MKTFLGFTFFVSCLAACGGPDVGPPPDGGRSDRGMVGPCEVPLEMCDGECVDTRSAGRHCGMCGNACGVGTFCQAGVCEGGCEGGLTPCGTSCVDTDTDVDNCGMCGSTCEPGSLCVGGTCACPMGFIRCTDVCVNPDADPMNCGLCGRTCGADERCNAGSCVCAGAEREMNCTDGADDDCDAMIDCADADCAGMTRPCMGGCGMGVETCQMGGTWGACEAGSGGTEICGDGIDQDCNGSDLRMPDMHETNDTCTTHVFPTAELDPDIMVTGSFDSVEDDGDFYAFDVEDNVSVFSLETIEIELSGIPVGHDYDVYLYKSESDCLLDRPLASGVRAGNAPERVSWTERDISTDTGTYIVKVISYTGHSCTANYTLRFNGLN